MNQMENFKNIIVEERRRAGLTQEALATRIGITPQAISKWENGVGYPDVTLFPIIASVLNIPIARLFGEEEKPITRKGTLPDTYGGLLFILAAGDAVCYASKGVEEADEERGIIRFHDGSEANLNTATLSELSADPNIGPELAAKIVEFRENVGDFTKYEDLKEIEGIDDAKIKQINEKFQIEGVASFDCNC